MAWMKYRIEGFQGINQAICENAVSPSESPDACNMETGGGVLSLAKGYVHASDIPLPEGISPLRLFPLERGEGVEFTAAAADGLYLLDREAKSWRQLASFQMAHTRPEGFDRLRLKIGTAEYVLFANGEEQMHKWDGERETADLFGSSEKLSDVPVSMVELYNSRLFAAGDPAHPARLYWSAIPGEDRSLEDWSSAEESENVGGGYVEVEADSDPITAIAALSNQLVIFKKNSLYRLLGDRPGNFRICPVNAAMDSCTQGALVRLGDVLYFLTRSGLYYYDGQMARRYPDGDKVQKFLRGADLSSCTAAAHENRLYFALREGNGPCNDAVLVYDLARSSYMIRRGFTLVDIASAGRKLYILDGRGYVCQFEEGTTYAGEEISAYWYTPETDLGDKCLVKQLKELYLRGQGGLISVTAETDAGVVYADQLMPGDTRGVLEMPLTGAGRSFRLRIANVGGSDFSIEGGAELLLDAQRRVL